MPTQNKQEIQVELFKREKRLTNAVKMWIVIQLLAFAALNAVLQTKIAAELTYENLVEREI